MKNSSRRDDPFESMPLHLMMLVEVRTAALKKYGEMSEEDRKKADDIARRAKDRMEKERLIDSIENGDFLGGKF